MVSAPEEAADTWCLIAGRKQLVTKYLQSLIPTGIRVISQTQAVTI